MSLPRLSKVFVVWTLVLAGLGVGFAYLAPSPFHAVLGTLIIWVGSAAVFMEARDADEPGYRLFSVAGLIAAASFGVPVFTAGLLFQHNVPIEYYGREFKDTATLFSIEALILALTGLVAFIVAFRVARPWFARRLPAFGRNRNIPNSSMLLLAWGLLLFGIAFYLSPWIRSLPSVNQLGQPAAMIAFSIFLTALCRRQISLGHAGIVAAAYGFILFRLAVEVSLPPILLYGLVAFFILWRESKRPPVWLIVIGILFVVATMQTFYIARTQIWGDAPYANASSFVKAQVIFSVATYQLLGTTFMDLDKIESVTRSARETQGGLIKRLIQRLNHLPHLTVGLQSLNDGRPILRGETYKPLFTSFIPRVVWPNKPREEVGRKFGYEYWDETDPRMSMNLPWMPEMLLNFGRLGVVFGMAIMGILFASLYAAFNSRDSDQPFSAVGLIILLPFVYPESNFSLMTGSLIPLAICMWLYFAIGPKLIDRIGLGSDPTPR